MKNLFYLSILSYCIAACNPKPTQNLVEVLNAGQIDNSPSSCPYLTKDNKGNIILSWVRQINDSTTAFCYATTEDGITFSEPVVIPNSGRIEPHGENLPKIIFKPSGEIIALWGTANPNPNNKYSGLVFYTQSFDSGKTWTDAKPLVTDTAGYDQRYYDVALLPNGEAGIIWLDNRKTTDKEGSALYFASTNGRNGFEKEKQISQSCCQCCRTDLFVDKQGGIHAVFRGIIHDSIRDMVHIVSSDDGKTFSEPRRINEDNWVIKGCPHTGPAITENNNGIHFAWFTGGKKKGCFYTKTADNGNSFAGADSISSLGSHPQLTSLPNGELLIVWDEMQFAKNKMAKRIGIQKRNGDGKSQGKGYLTDENSNASYPVIAPLDETSSIVAYSTNEEGKDYVAYRTVKLH